MIIPHCTPSPQTCGGVKCPPCILHNILIALARPSPTASVGNANPIYHGSTCLVLYSPSSTRPRRASWPQSTLHGDVPPGTQAWRELTSMGARALAAAHRGADDVSFPHQPPSPAHRSSSLPCPSSRSAATAIEYGHEATVSARSFRHLEVPTAATGTDEILRRSLLHRRRTKRCRAYPGVQR